MEPGGDLLLGDGSLLNSRHICHTGIHGWQQVGRIETPESRLRHLQDFPDQRGSQLDPLVALARGGPQAHRREWRLDHVRCPEVRPVLREPIERDHALLVVRQPLDGLRGYCPVPVAELGA